jgi:acetoin utilization deacetylase AcuC-like enzyme
MKTIKVFYRDEQTVTENESFSPSAGKPAQVLASWQDLGLPIEVMKFKALTESEISLAHDSKYVADVLSLSTSNGFGNHSAAVAFSLPFTTGSLAAATLYALKNGETCASLTSGFHHAGFDHGGGFCTFNGIMVAARMALSAGAKKVGILDCDNHYGDGTANIIRELGLDDEIHHWTFGGESITTENSKEWLRSLPGILSKFSDCDVIIYQAGADPHIEDPLGGVLTSEQMRRRDKVVFDFFNQLKIPVAWNLAGGYQKPLRKVLDLHDATMQECVSSYLTKEEQNEESSKGEKSHG